MIKLLRLDMPRTRSHVYAWERRAKIAGGGYVVTCNGSPVCECSTADEARDQADSYNGEVMRQARKPIVRPPVVLTGEALRKQVQQDIADIFG